MDKAGYYWDVSECAWVECPAVDPAHLRVPVPQQATGPDDQPAGVASAESDVRSG